MEMRRWVNTCFGGKIGSKCPLYMGWESVRGGSQGELEQGSPTPGPRTGTGLWPVRNQATQQEVRAGQASEASSAAPHHSNYRLNHPLPDPYPWKNCLPRNWSLVPKMLGTAEPKDDSHVLAQ